DERRDIDGKYIFRGNIRNRKLVIIDDVYTTGTTIKNAVDAIERVESNLKIYACVIAKVKKVQG
ncbi:MAG: hypothetical protein J7L34_04925, partial [Thermotogaceae bacterium]|nr:hypothetical protein [Thermotogaceae bacterium]